ncbi:MAG: hypothetical protein H7Z14_04525 [Anaerolineae bacterium]|nr:hypothetical protein [Phycisphaerae bacterium]
MTGSAFAELFTSDLAAEVRGEFEERVGFGLSSKDATVHVVARFGSLLSDPNDGPVVIVCLAALQFEAGGLFQSFRDAAIELIDTREAQRAWKCFDHEAGQQRRAVLDRLATALRGANVISDADEER